MVSKWETEQSYPDVELLPKLADIFEITLDELFGRDNLKEEAKRTTMALPWEDDNNLRAVVFVGHQFVEKKDM